MKKVALLLFAFFVTFQAKAWWDAGHMITAIIAYQNLNPKVKAKVDELVKTLERDYPYTNHFVAMGTWPDDLKAEGVKTYNTWHYTNLPYNPNGVALPTMPLVDVIWAIEQTQKTLSSKKAKDVEKARQLAFLIHFVGDLHQPLHSTSYYNNDLPAGNIGGNAFPIASFGKWKNLHAAWDDGCGFTSDYNDINPYGEPKKPLTKDDLMRLGKFAKQIQKTHPKKSLIGIELSDPDFWALESHKLAIEYGYKGVQSVSEEGRKKYVQPNDPLSEYYLEQGQKVVEKRLAMGGYRLANILNNLFSED